MKGDKIRITSKKHPYYNSVGYIIRENVLTFKGKRNKIKLAEAGDMNGRTFFAFKAEYETIKEEAR